MNIYYILLRVVKFWIIVFEIISLKVNFEKEFQKKRIQKLLPYNFLLSIIFSPRSNNKRIGYKPGTNNFHK